MIYFCTSIWSFEWFQLKYMGISAVLILHWSEKGHWTLKPIYCGLWACPERNWAGSVASAIWWHFVASARSRVLLKRSQIRSHLVEEWLPLLSPGAQKGNPGFTWNESERFWECSAGLDLPHVLRTWLCQSNLVGCARYNWSITKIVFKVLLLLLVAVILLVAFNLI